MHSSVILLIISGAIISGLVVFLLMVQNKLKHYKRTVGDYQVENETLQQLIKTSDQVNTEELMMLALSLQAASLPNDKIFEEHFSDFFIYFRPKNCLGGDFYYLHNKNGRSIITVADCTGHGLSGALASLFGLTCLNEIVSKPEFENSDEILNELRKKFLSYFHKKEDHDNVRIGMDISLCIIDRNKMEMQFSGAFNPLYVISGNNLEVHRGDRIPISNVPSDIAYYTRYNFSLREGDIIYLFSDGYYDQFGGTNRKKFMTKRFSHLLLNIYQFPMDKQKEWLDNTLNAWMGENNQVDDITVVGIKI